MKAIALVSGGLDSLLATRIIKEQGIEIVPLNFKIPFCHRRKDIPCEWITSLKTVDISNEFLRLLKNPKYGFGSNMNPCIDCKILMLRKAKELMKEYDAAFVITGEVLGQRPMSQNRKALEIIENQSGLMGLVLRPLSAKLLKETIPEIKGWVDRTRLLGFYGRTRKPQIELAKSFNMKDYPNASGGCLLTDPGFAKRLKDLMIHQELSLDDIELLKIGRHYRLSESAKLIVGRNERENSQLIKFAKDNDYLFYPDETIAGPISLGRGDFNKELIRFSCSITSRYCDLNGRPDTDILYRKISQATAQVLKVRRAKESDLEKFRI